MYRTAEQHVSVTVREAVMAAWQASIEPLNEDHLKFLDLERIIRSIKDGGKPEFPIERLAVGLRVLKLMGFGEDVLVGTLHGLAAEGRLTVKVFRQKIEPAGTHVVSVK